MYTDVMGKLDPKTGKITVYPSPYGEKATRDMFEDSEGRLWYGAQPYYKAGYIRLRGDAENPWLRIARTSGDRFLSSEKLIPQAPEWPNRNRIRGDGWHSPGIACLKVKTCSLGASLGVSSEGARFEADFFGG